MASRGNGRRCEVAISHGSSSIAQIRNRYNNLSARDRRQDTMPNGVMNASKIGRRLSPRDTPTNTYTRILKREDPFVEFWISHAIEVILAPKRSSPSVCGERKIARVKRRKLDGNYTGFNLALETSRPRLPLEARANSLLE